MKYRCILKRSGQVLFEKLSPNFDVKKSYHGKERTSIQKNRIMEMNEDYKIPACDQKEVITYDLQ